MSESALEDPHNDQQYDYVAQAIAYIRAHARQQPSLGEIAAALNLSEYHLQRIFTAWAGVSPKRFLQVITKQRALDALKHSDDVLSAALNSGLSSPGRLHDLMVSCEAMSPGEIKALGKGLRIGFGSALTPFGHALIGWTPRGICYLQFYETSSEEKETELASQWSAASLFRDDLQAAQFSKQIFAAKHPDGKLHLVVKGTNFQVKVWEALLSTRSSEIISYAQLAKLIDSPKAQRAAGSAVAANTIGYLIPCHRVIRGDGDTGNFRWGSDRKVAIQAWEAGNQQEQYAAS